MSSQIETAIIIKNSHGYELTDNDGETIGFYPAWKQIADMFRRENFSEEYIAKRKAEISRGDETIAGFTSLI
jgi:hypothetical protein